jgi:large subunit ribosomal protein L21
MNYAIISNGGKQYKVSEGTVLELDRINTEPGKELILDKVLMTVDGDTINLGTPYLANATVTAEVLDNTQGEKIRVSQFKAKARHRRTIGFRAQLTKVKVTGLGKKAEKTAKA